MFYVNRDVSQCKDIGGSDNIKNSGKNVNRSRSFEHLL